MHRQADRDIGIRIERRQIVDTRREREREREREKGIDTYSDGHVSIHWVLMGEAKA